MGMRNCSVSSLVIHKNTNVHFTGPLDITGADGLIAWQNYYNFVRHCFREQRLLVVLTESIGELNDQVRRKEARGFHEKNRDPHTEREV
mmetsp:Transcript_14313/g.19077  ORF Transcript_14313/g.19077 Transcript_14313/m.19077 type:complete len:89 (-) Transcript_14313:34-300(-)